MSTLPAIRFADYDPKELSGMTGHVVVLVTPEGVMDQAARSANRLTKGALARLIAAPGFEESKLGTVTTLNWPAGMAAEALHVQVLPRRITPTEARKAGAKLVVAAAGKSLTVMAGSIPKAAELAMGIALRSYGFDNHKTAQKDKPAAEITIAHKAFDEMAAAYAPLAAVAEGVHMTRDRVNEPANVLTTTEFARRIEDMSAIGLEIEILDEPALEELGMGALLCVGQGSDSPSKVAIMQWKGGAEGEAPLALVGKGVVFDTGGISLKPAAGMEDMTMDMGGAGVVVGTMKALALRKARANVVGLVGLVENMPSGNATRPGDVVKSMKGDTIEVINTDAEGRLVLCDVMWYAQERFKPCGMIDLATLTGAIIIGLGHENAGVFSNEDALCNGFLKAAKSEDEGAWRMPLGQAYDDQIKSRIADMKNTGGRPAGSITAAQFLKRFVKEDTPWIHLDIAGVASVKSATSYAPKGATGWGVMALNRLVQDKFEAE
ncbi:leucyl aminopeptidase [Pseudophaeobacter leonis]|uniref:leucyl aminopeptidase n=1 Tax=Pseudophaeobacter leonis TaxID=1144477 RepID=UPI0009F5B5FD|nr:leucyl aminopeptidase [Pseudophaeobacter leonis]